MAKFRKVIKCVNLLSTGDLNHGDLPQMGHSHVSAIQIFNYSIFFSIMDTFNNSDDTSML